MRTLITKWICGCSALAAPVLVAIVGRKLDHSAFQHSQMYKAMIPPFAFGSVALAVLVPTLLLLTSSLSGWRRVVSVIGLWCFLVFELYGVFLFAAASS